MAQLLPDPQRRLLREGLMSVFTPQTGKRDLQVFLFSDLVVRSAFVGGDSSSDAF